MKLSTRIKKYVPLCGDGKSGICTKLIVLMVDCKRTELETYCLDLADEYHRYLTKDEHCTILPQESPVINGKGEIIFHYTSTTYKEWCKA